MPQPMLKKSKMAPGGNQEKAAFSRHWAMWTLHLALVLPLALLFGLALASIVMLPLYMLGILPSLNLDYHLTYQSPVVVYMWLFYRLATDYLVVSVLCVLAMGIALAAKLRRSLRADGSPGIWTAILIVAWLLLLIILALGWFLSGWNSL